MPNRDARQPGHPRTRVTETELDRQMLALFDKMRIENEEVRDWVPAIAADMPEYSGIPSTGRPQENRASDFRFSGAEGPHTLRVGQWPTVSR